MIENFLTRNGLSEYKNLFAINKISFSDLTAFSNEDLRQIGIDNQAHRIIILNQLNLYKKNLRIKYIIEVVFCLIAIGSIFLPYFDFSFIPLENPIGKYSGIDGVYDFNSIISLGPFSSLFWMLIMPLLIPVILLVDLIITFSKNTVFDATRVNQWIGAMFSFLLFVCWLMMILISFGINTAEISYYQYGDIGYYLYLLTFFIGLMIPFWLDLPNDWYTNVVPSVDRDYRHIGEVSIRELAISSVIGEVESRAVLDLVKEGKLKRALDRLISAIESNDSARASSNYQIVIGLRSRMAELDNERRIGVWGTENEVKLNIIRNELIKVLTG